MVIEFHRISVIVSLTFKIGSIVLGNSSLFLLLVKYSILPFKSDNSYLLLNRLSRNRSFSQTLTGSLPRYCHEYLPFLGSFVLFEIYATNQKYGPCNVPSVHLQPDFPHFCHFAIRDAIEVHKLYD